MLTSNSTSPPHHPSSHTILLPHTRPSYLTPDPPPSHHTTVSNTSPFFITSHHSFSHIIILPLIKQLHHPNSNFLLLPHVSLPGLPKIRNWINRGQIISFLGSGKDSLVISYWITWDQVWGIKRRVKEFPSCRSSALIVAGLSYIRPLNSPFVIFAS